jgi:hypothetical protein
LDADKKPRAYAAWLMALLREHGELLQLTRAKDRDYLNSLIDGSGDLLTQDTFAKLEPLFTRYEADPVMNALLERAAEAYADAALWAAAWVVAGIYIEDAQRCS